MADGFYLYILASRRNGTLYVGVTNDLTRRVWEHKSNLVPGFTRIYDVNKLVFCECYESIDQAREAEQKLKRWRRDWKLELIEKANPQWRDLAEDFPL